MFINKNIHLYGTGKKTDIRFLRHLEEKVFSGSLLFSEVALLN